MKENLQIYVFAKCKAFGKNVYCLQPNYLPSQQQSVLSLFLSAWTLFNPICLYNSALNNNTTAKFMMYKDGQFEMLYITSVYTSWIALQEHPLKQDVFLSELVHNLYGINRSMGKNKDDTSL